MIEDWGHVDTTEESRREYERLLGTREDPPHTPYQSKKDYPGIVTKKAVEQASEKKDLIPPLSPPLNEKSIPRKKNLFSWITSWCKNICLRANKFADSVFNSLWK